MIGRMNRYRKHSFIKKQKIQNKGQLECIYCGLKLFEEHHDFNRRPTIEHIIPRSKGGSNKQENLAIACYNCNQEKARVTSQESRHSYDRHY